MEKNRSRRAFGPSAVIFQSCAVILPALITSIGVRNGVQTLQVVVIQEGVFLINVSLVPGRERGR